jgi:hypothetical protein
VPYDERIVSGAWVSTRFGKAVCIAVEPHDHGLVDRHPRPGWCVCACEDDSCADARTISFRYRATRHHDEKEIWVTNGDLSGDKGWQVRFLRPPTRFTARILKLYGPYGDQP